MQGHPLWLQIDLPRSDRPIGCRFTFWTLVVFGGIALLGLLGSLPSTAPVTAHQHAPATHSDEHAAGHGHHPAAVGSEFDGLDAHALAHLGGGGQGPTLREQVAALGGPRSGSRC